MKAATGKERWIYLAAYTLTGAVTSALVGAALGAVGRLLVPDPMVAAGLGVSVGVAGLAAAHELGWVPLRLPQVRRQTRDVWAKRFRPGFAAALWGADLGLVFTTWFTFSGVWLLVVLAIVSRHPASGAGLFTAYWLGRAASVWIAPALVRDASATPLLLDEIEQRYGALQRVHVAALALAIGIVGVIAFA